MILTGELPEESEQFRFLLVGHLTNIKVSTGLNLAKASIMRVLFPSICLHVLTFLYLVFNSRHTPPLLNPSLVLFPQ